jgi:streptogramin lyase
VWVCDASQNSIRRFDPKPFTWETLADTVDGFPLAKPNDLAFDPRGRLLFTVRAIPGLSQQDILAVLNLMDPYTRSPNTSISRTA